MPSYAMVIIFQLNTYLSYSLSSPLQRVILVVVFISTFLIPVLFSLILMKKGIIQSLKMESLEERRLPFITTAFFYTAAFFLIRQLPVPRFIPLIILGAALVIILSFFISLKWKISIHMMGIGGLCGLIWGLSEIVYAQIILLFIFLIVLSGLIGTARLISSTHTPMQIYSGFITGFAIELIVIKFYAG